ncbi:MAG: hypothetical protein ACOCXM_04090 [Myxococcota bacterium]
MKSGRGRMMAGMILAVVLAAGAVALYLGSGGDEAYASFGKEVNGLDRSRYDGFWGCVMQGLDLDRIRSDRDLRNQLHKRAERGRSRFGSHVRDQCLPELAELEPGLEAIVPPEGMGEPLRAMSDAVSRLRGAFSDYVAHLDGLEEEEPYSEEAASDHVGAIAKAWYDYTMALSELNRELKSRLDG